MKQVCVSEHSKAGGRTQRGNQSPVLFTEHPSYKDETGELQPEFV